MCQTVCNCETFPTGFCTAAHSLRMTSQIAFAAEHPDCKAARTDTKVRHATCKGTAMDLLTLCPQTPSGYFEVKNKGLVQKSALRNHGQTK